MKIYWDIEADDWNMIPDFIDVLRGTYNIFVEAYTEDELIEIIRDLLKKELSEKI